MLTSGQSGKPYEKARSSFLRVVVNLRGVLRLTDADQFQLFIQRQQRRLGHLECLSGQELRAANDHESRGAVVEFSGADRHLEFACPQFPTI
jgi:hypothetical protein